VRCAAVPIFLGTATPAAAVSVTVLGSRAEASRLSELGSFLRRAVAEWAQAPAQ
jgi:DNA-binding IclR family transcriptional regulator